MGEGGRRARGERRQGAARGEVVGGRGGGARSAGVPRGLGCGQLGWIFARVAASYLAAGLLLLGAHFDEVALGARRAAVLPPRLDGGLRRLGVAAVAAPDDVEVLQVLVGGKERREALEALRNSSRRLAAVALEDGVHVKVTHGIGRRCALAKTFRKLDHTTV
jgi:hypothetical protein